MSSSDIAVSVRGLSKSYTIAHQAEKHSTLAETLLARAKNPFKRAEKETFWALKDVNFDIKKGEVVGIIGRNGAGKSTLLKILSRITEPTTGQIDLYGRVGSLLEVGTGFHPELTGRENIYLNGAILGMNKAEIRNQFEAIVDFAGVSKFLDTPVKRYSSGMYVRLAFAVAAHLNLELLILDEVLAVGDMAFQEKCLTRMRSLAENGKTVLIVSHDMRAVATLCQRCILLERGLKSLDDETTRVLETYLSSSESSTSLRVDLSQAQRHYSTGQAIAITEIELLVAGERAMLLTDSSLQFAVSAIANQSADNVYFGIGINDGIGHRLFTCEGQANAIAKVKKGDKISTIITIPKPSLRPGNYSVTVGANAGIVECVDHCEDVLTFTVIPSQAEDFDVNRSHLGLRGEANWQNVITSPDEIRSN